MFGYQAPPTQYQKLFQSFSYRSLCTQLPKDTGLTSKPISQQDDKYQINAYFDMTTHRTSNPI